jgi:hypothetical protein
MRILIVGSHKTWRMERGVERAMRRLGHETLLIDDRRAKRLIGRRMTQRWALWHARRFRPDFVFLSKCLGLDHETVARLIENRPNAMWYLDPPYYKYPERPDVAHILGVARLARTFFVSGFVAEWRALGPNAKLLPAAGDRAIVPVPADPAYAAELSFIGTGYDEQRANFLLELAKHFRVRVWGRGWEAWREPLAWGGRPVEGREFAAVCSSSAITLGINPVIASGATDYASNRMWITMLAGGFYMGERTPGIDRMLLDGEHCAWYDGVGDAVARARRWLDDAAGRERVRRAGEAFVREHHTFDDRVRHLLADEAWTNPLA